MDGTAGRPALDAFPDELTRIIRGIAWLTQNDAYKDPTDKNTTRAEKYAIAWTRLIGMIKVYVSHVKEGKVENQIVKIYRQPMPMDMKIKLSEFISRELTK